jgi:uncharacterized OB-fold protein
MSQDTDKAVSEGVRIWRCTACGTGYFPQRLLCSRCRGHDFAEGRVTEGVVEEITVIRHVLGQTDWQPHRIANVRTANGPQITVGLRDESEVGAVIALFEEGNAPFGVAKATSMG